MFDFGEHTTHSSVVGIYKQIEKQQKVLGFQCFHVF